MDLGSAVPLDAEEMIATATRREGLADFGEDYWREPFCVLIDALDKQASLSLFGRVATRDLLISALRTRLQIEATYARHPEIDDEVIDAPVIVTGLPRSGTSILFEVLAVDPRLKPLLSWEVESPCPPPMASTYTDDPRIPRAAERIERRLRMAPDMITRHELGALVPAECGTAQMYYSFTSDHLTVRYNIPSYADWLYEKADWISTYAYHRRLLKLLQWKNPRSHWLLKSPPHIWHLEPLFEIFPDARVIFTHRDPLRAHASGTSLVATLRGMWTDEPFDPESLPKTMQAEYASASLNRVIDLIEADRVPREQVFNFHYAEFMREPLVALRGLYGSINQPLPADTEARMASLLAAKPQHKFGVHAYEVAGDADRRKVYERYQRYYQVEIEA